MAEPTTKTQLRYVESWAVIRLADNTPAVVTNTDKRGFRMVKIGRDHGRWVNKNEEVEIIYYAAQLAHMFLESLVAPTLPPAPERYCDKCGKPLDNLQGVFVMSNSYGSPATICHRCYPAMLTSGFTVVAQAR